LKNKITLLFAVMFCSTQLFALDAKARVVLTGNLAEETKKSGEDAKYEFFKLNNKPQKDDDGIVVEFNGGNFGGRLGLWYEVNNATGGNGSNVNFRRTNLWIKPVEQVKLTVGYVGNDQLYKEQIDSWKVGNPFKFDTRDWGAHPGYVNCSDVDDMGFGLEIKPIDGLILTGGVARRWGTPGNFEKPFWNYDGDKSEFNAWGVTARYYHSGFCYQAGYRDNGKESWKVARVAVGYEQNGIMAFIQPCFGIDYITADDEYKLTGICLDMYGEYKWNSFTFMLRAPVTIRVSDESRDTDPSYMEYMAMVKYNTGKHANMDDLSPFIKFGSMNHDGDQPLAFYRFNSDFSDSVNFDITPGVMFNVGGCEVDVGFEMLVRSELYKKANNSADMEWRVPFTAKMKF